MLAAEDAAAAVAVMALATYGTRIGGLLLMARVPQTPRLESFLRYLSSSVLVALVVGLILEGDAAAWIAVAIGAVVAAVTGRSLVALGVAVLVAAAVRYFV